MSEHDSRSKVWEAGSRQQGLDHGPMEAVATTLNGTGIIQKL